MPAFYSTIVDNIFENTVRQELREIASYVANTLENLYLLANSTNIQNLILEKRLIYLPACVENEIFVISIIGSGENSSRVNVYLRSKPWVSADCWLHFPGLRVGEENRVESGQGTAVVWCNRNAHYIYIGMRIE